ncbi:MAG: hypothetical protein P8Z81_15715 [Deinococcales bacterium]
MPRRIRLGLVLAAAVLTLPALALAQNTPAPTPPAAAQQQSLGALERQAARLTLINRLPQADRAEATKLLDRADALRQRARQLRIEELRAYIAALKAGDAPAAARVQAQQKVSDARLTLAKDAATLRTDAQAFLQKVPEARALLRSLSMRNEARRTPGASANGAGNAGTRQPGTRGFRGFNGMGGAPGAGTMRQGVGRGGQGPRQPWGMGGAAPYGRMPYGQQRMPYGQGRMPYGMMPYGMMPYGWAPYGAAPNGAAPNGAAPYGMMPNAMPWQMPWQMPWRWWDRDPGRWGTPQPNGPQNAPQNAPQPGTPGAGMP